MLTVVAGLILVALIFDYINGFHDAANSIATVVSTRVLSPGKAVLWAAFFNFVAAFTFGTAVAKTVGSGLVDIWTSTRESIFAPWSPPVNLGTRINTQYADLFPALSADGTTLVFTSNRPDDPHRVGGDDLYVTTRKKSSGMPGCW